MNTIHPVLAGSPLRRLPYAIVVLGLLLIIFMLAFSQFLQPFTMTEPLVQVLLTGLLMTTLASFVPFIILRFLDRRERESLWVMLIAFLWGAVIATGLALPINRVVLNQIAELLNNAPELLQRLGPNAPLLIGAPIAGPLVEEIVKGLGVLVLLVLLRGEFDNMRDGLIYGALIGMGFTWFETSMYLVKGVVTCGDPAWGLQFGSRYALFGLAGHALYTGLFGMFLGLARQTTAGWVKVTAPLFGLALAIGAHVIHNGLPLLFSLVAQQPPTDGVTCQPDLPLLQAFLQFSLIDLILFTPALLLIGLGIWRSGIWERRIIREELRTEAPEIVTPEELDRIEHDHILRTRRIAALDRARSRRIVNAQNEIAFRKRKLRQRGLDPDQDRVVQHWRDIIRSLRAPERARRQRGHNRSIRSSV
ncbi:MAG: PrsW family intramembrane metalloprotease [Candidatus Flexifilum sp.]